MTVLEIARPPQFTASGLTNDVSAIRSYNVERADSRSRRRAEVVTFFALLAIYLVLALWMRAGLHYAIGDALSRNASARNVLFGSQPKLSALGFVWPPLPTIVQLPFVLVLEPFGHAAVAGLMMSALFGAATGVVLLRLADKLGVVAWAKWLLVGLYALNPITAFHAANGMSESPYFFFLAVLAYGFSGWIVDRRIPSLVMAAMALLGLMMTRLETLFLVPLVGVAAALVVSGARQRVRIFIVTILPAAFGQFVWMFTAKLIVGNFLYTIENPGATTGGPPPGSRWMADYRPLSYAIRFATKLTGIHGVGFFVIAVIGLVMMWRRGKVFAFGVVTVIAACGFFPALQAYLISHDRSWGDPRYFSTITVFAPILALWILQTSAPCTTLGRRDITKSTLVSAAVALACVVALAANAIVGTMGLSNPTTTAIEQEWVAIRAMSGRARPPEEGLQNYIRLNEFFAISRLADEKLAANSSDAVLVETRSAFPVMLWTKNPNKFIGDSDERFESFIAANGGPVRYAVTSRATKSTILDLMLSKGPGWHQIADSGLAQLWERTPIAGG